MQELTEKQWENVCKDCNHPNLHVALLEYDNLDEYLRRIVIAMERIKPSDDSQTIQSAKKSKVKVCCDNPSCIISAIAESKKFKAD